jgi:phosphatidylglycerol lysyltransferase
MNATTERAPHPRPKLPAWLRPTFGALILLAAALVVDDELLSASWPQVQAAVRALAWTAVLLAALATVGGLTAASAYDALALRALDRPLPWRKTATISVLGSALSYGGALGAVAVMALRLRAYGPRGRSAAEVERLSTWTSTIGLAGGTALLALGLAAPFIPGAEAWTFGLGVLGLVGLGAYLVLPRRGLEQLVPPPREAALQLAFSTVEWLAAGFVLYVLLPADARGLALTFLPVYALARLLGAASSLPAGIGVFEAVMLAAFSGHVPPPQLAAALAGYRLIYFVAPLVLAAARVAMDAAPRSTAGKSAGRDAVNAALPGVLGLLIFLAGVVMLVSAATPGVAARIRISAAFTPVAVLETSHFIDSLIGALLLFLAFGLNSRLRKAWRATIVLLIVGAASTLLRGLNYEEALFLTLAAVLLFAGRRAFYRTSPLRSSPLTPGMAISIIAAMAAVCWLGFFAFRHVAYRDELWWTFVADEGAPRLLRAYVGVAALALGVFAWRLIQPRARITRPVDPALLEHVEAVLSTAANAAPDASLAYLGDKQFLFSDSGASFVQYAARDRDWVALGEPVGPAEEKRAMIWAFRELCDRHGARPVFYAVRRDSVADFVDCGFVAAKIGENAVVDLATFSMTGRARQDLRTARSRAEREGLTFGILSAEAVDSRMAELQAISDAWLETHQGEEKGFSLGRFDPAYIRRFDMAVLQREGRIVAFTNLWRTADGRRLSVDLMRYSPDAPPQVMDALLVELLLWAQANGYVSCDLGRTPLAGLEEHRLANLMTRIGSLIYTHAGRLYGFEGLRRFKGKFLPRWESTYIAAPTGWQLPSALSDAALLSSGGVRGLFK